MKIRKFQALMRQLYIHQDQKRGLENTFIWLVEEIGELANCLNKKNIEKSNIEEELSDVIAWTFSLANLLEIDLETALKENYPDRCKKCESNPCRCSKLL
jgi:NTP pyrophosphatase (non-canonical NTP hydrolase)